jgi:hypothetical protein
MIASINQSKDSIQIKINPLLFRVLGIISFLSLLPLALLFGVNQGLHVFGVPTITYFNACGLICLAAFVMFLVVATVVIIKELV